MAKRKRLTPARMIGAASPAPAVRAPIAEIAQDAATSAALEDLSAELTTARQEGRLIQKLPLTSIEINYISRDRQGIAPEDQTALINSLRDRGQQTAIEVAELRDGKYGLISGYRRVAALREIPEIDTVLAIVRKMDQTREIYRAMVDENEMRVGISFYERACVACHAAEMKIYPDETAALRGLFDHVPRARRSKIKSFMTIVRHLNKDLRFPWAISEKQGLALAKALSEDPSRILPMRKALFLANAQTAKEEQAFLMATLRAFNKVGAASRSDHPDKADPALAPGLEMVRHKNGAITLQGPKLADPEYVARLIQTLKTLD